MAADERGSREQPPSAEPQPVEPEGLEEPAGRGVDPGEVDARIACRFAHLGCASLLENTRGEAEHAPWCKVRSAIAQLPLSCHATGPPLTLNCHSTAAPNCRAMNVQLPRN